MRKGFLEISLKELLLVSLFYFLHHLLGALVHEIISSFETISRRAAYARHGTSEADGGSAQVLVEVTAGARRQEVCAVSP